MTIVSVAVGRDNAYGLTSLNTWQSQAFFFTLLEKSPSHLLEKSQHMETSVAPLAYAICMASRTYGGTKKEATAKHGNS